MQHAEYGHFDDANREYVITNPKTPFPWINYLGNEDFFGLISNTAGGYNFYKDAKFRRITRYRYNSVPMDSAGRYFYVKDGETVWNPGWKPCTTALDNYECRHGLNYTRITSEKNAVRAGVLFFVPLGEKDHHIINKARAHEVIERFATVEAVDKAFAELCALWDELLSKYHVESSDERLN